jgi:hypothetical protein
VIQRLLQIVVVFVSRGLVPSVEELLDSPVFQASRVWTRWVMIATMHAAGGTVEESVSQIRDWNACKTLPLELIHVSSVFPVINLHLLVHCHGTFHQISLKLATDEFSDFGDSRFSSVPIPSFANHFVCLVSQLG